MRFKTLPIILFIGLALLLAACGGGKEPIIEKPAGEINLTIQDLDDGWTLVEEQEDLKAVGLNPSGYRDANIRFFQGDNPAIQVMGMVATAKSVEDAVKELGKTDILGDMAESMLKQLPEMRFEPIEAPPVGDEQDMVHGVYESFGLHLYVLVFRKANMISMVMLMGPDDIANLDAVTRYAQTIAARAEP